MDSFLSTIIRSGLLTETDLTTLLDQTSSEAKTHPRILADHFVKIGKLSSFQAQKLLKGAYIGLLLGPYEIVAPIGKGGMGAVYLARDTRVQKLLALKVLPPKKAKANDRLLQRFQRELEINQRVAHPHIAWTYEGGDIQGVFYIAMEFIPGKTLSRLVIDNGPFEVPRLARIAVEVALGLHHAHTQGVIHRDLKPGNIMITPSDHAKVLDLGLALMEDEIAANREIIGGLGYVVGSMDYIAPEQIRNAATVDARADVYSLGCTLYFALTRRPPFPGGDAKEKMRRHRREQPVYVRELNPAVPEGFAQIVHTMMAKRPEDRYPTMKDAREDLFFWAKSHSEALDEPTEDAVFQKAVEDLTTAAISLDLVNSSILSTTDSTETPVAPPLFPSDITLLDDNHHVYYWMAVGIVGFWVIVLVILGIVLLLK